MSAAAILAFIKSLWKIPQGKQLITLVLWALVVMGFVCVFLANGWITSNDRAFESEKEKAVLQEQCGTKVYAVKVWCDSSRMADRDKYEREKDETIAELKDELRELKAGFNGLVSSQRKTIRTQKEVRQTINRALNEVKK